MMPFFQTMLPDDMHMIDPDDVVAAVLEPINRDIDGEFSITATGSLLFSLDQDMVQEYAVEDDGYYFLIGPDDVALLQAAMRLPR